MFPTSPRLYTHRILNQKLKALRQNSSSSSGVQCFVSDADSTADGILYEKTEGGYSTLVLECICRDDPHGELESIVEAGCSFMVTVDGVPRRANTEDATYHCSAIPMRMVDSSKRWEALNELEWSDPKHVRIRDEMPFEYAAAVAYGITTLTKRGVDDLMDNLRSEEKENVMYALYVLSEADFEEQSEHFAQNLKPNLVSRARRVHTAKPMTFSRRRYKTRLIEHLIIS